MNEWHVIEASHPDTETGVSLTFVHHKGIFLAVAEVVADIICTNPSKFEHHAHFREYVRSAIRSIADQPLPETELHLWLTKQLAALNSELLKLNEEYYSLSIAFAFCAPDGTLLIAHVGDIAAYAEQDGALHRLTCPHTLATSFALAGQAGGQSIWNIYTQLLPATDCTIDAPQAKAVAGSRFLFCTRNLFMDFTHDELTKEVGNCTNASGLCNRLLELATQKNCRSLSLIVAEYSN